MHWFLTGVVAVTGAATEPAEPIAARRAFFGEVISAVGDLDGGGVPELAVALDEGCALYSGETGELRWRAGANATSFTSIRDFDGDGVRDVVAASIEVRILSGATGKLLGVRSAGTMLAPGLRVDSLGDEDGDGYEELFVESADRAQRISLDPKGRRTTLDSKRRKSRSRLVVPLPGGQTGATRDVAFVDWGACDENGDAPSLLRLQRAIDGARITLTGLCANRFPRPVDDPCRWGEDRYELAPAGDVDGDGRCDVIVAVIGACAWTFSTRDGACLATFADPEPGGYQAWSGGSIVVLGDLDGDRIDDVAIGCRDHLGGVTDPYAAVFSGRTGARLGLIPQAYHEGHDHIVAAPGDVDRDGKADVAVLIPRCNSVTIHSGADFRLIRTLSPPGPSR